MQNTNQCKFKRYSRHFNSICIKYVDVHITYINAAYAAYRMSQNNFIRFFRSRMIHAMVKHIIEVINLIIMLYYLPNLINILLVFLIYF